MHKCIHPYTIYINRSEQGRAVVEVGPGKGALTATLLNLYPKMKAVEVDEVKHVNWKSAHLCASV